MPADKIYNVLFLCTGNSARSVLAEVLLNQVGNGRFKGFSAGSTPKGSIHPLTLAVLTDAGLPTEGLRSKSWDEFAGPEAPKMDFIFTVCDNAAGEACPIWPGKPVSAHWGIEDPAAAGGPPFAQRAAFEDALRYMRNRIVAFTNLPIASLDRMTLDRHMREIGAMAGSSQKTSGAA